MVKNQGTKQRVQRILGDCRQWETNGQCVKGDNCSFRHDINKLAKLTQPNPSPNSFMRQNERESSRTRSPRGKSPSGRMSQWPCKDYLRGTCNNSFRGKWQIGKKENLSPMDVTIDRGNLGRGVIRNWDKIHLNFT